MLETKIEWRQLAGQPDDDDDDDGHEDHHHIGDNKRETSQIGAGLAETSRAEPSVGRSLFVPLRG